MEAQAPARLEPPPTPPVPEPSRLPPGCAAKWSAPAPPPLQTKTESEPLLAISSKAPPASPPRNARDGPGAGPEKKRRRRCEACTPLAMIKNISPSCSGAGGVVSGGFYILVIFGQILISFGHFRVWIFLFCVFLSCVGGVRSHECHWHAYFYLRSHGATAVCGRCCKDFSMTP